MIHAFSAVVPDYLGRESAWVDLSDLTPNQTRLPDIGCVSRRVVCRCTQGTRSARRGEVQDVSICVASRSKAIIQRYQV
jgi:hypothetical protein